MVGVPIPVSHVCSDSWVGQYISLAKPPNPESDACPYEPSFRVTIHCPKERSTTCQCESGVGRAFEGACRSVD